jgi:putative hemolysin
MSLLLPPLLAVVVVVAWLTAGSMAVRSVSRIWLRHWADRRLRGAATAITYLERPQRLLIAANAGIALAVVFGGVLLGASLAWDHVRFSIALLVFAIALLFFGQILPRAIARRWPANLIPVLMPALRLAEVVAAPLLALGRAIADRMDPRALDRDEDRDPIHDLLREGELEGVGQRDEIAIITGVVEFGEKLVRDVMTPVADVFALPVDMPPTELADAVARAGYSRVPLYTGSIQSIVGMVHVIDILKYGGERLPPPRPIVDARDDALCTELLFRMLKGKRHLAIVKSASGETRGLVTLEDLIEELVGDIRDEFDEPPPPAPSPA